MPIPVGIKLLRCFIHMPAMLSFHVTPSQLCIRNRKPSVSARSHFMNHNEYVLSIRYDNQLILLRTKPQQLYFVLFEVSSILNFSPKAFPHTSESKSFTKLPAAFINFQTIVENSSASFREAVGSWSPSFETCEGFGAVKGDAALEVLFLCSTVPLHLSKIIVAITPGLCESRPRASSQGPDERVWSGFLPCSKRLLDSLDRNEALRAHLRSSSPPLFAAAPNSNLTRTNLGVDPSAALTDLNSPCTDENCALLAAMSAWKDSRPESLQEEVSDAGRLGGWMAAGRIDAGAALVGTTMWKGDKVVATEMDRGGGVLGMASGRQAAGALMAVAIDPGAKMASSMSRGSIFLAIRIDA